MRVSPLNNKLYKYMDYKCFVQCFILSASCSLVINDFFLICLFLIFIVQLELTFDVTLY